MPTDWAALAASAPTGEESGPTGPSKPIGIPETYRPTRPDGGPRFVPDPYYDGAEFGPRVLSPETRARLQEAMRQAGLYGKSDTYRLGVWDDVSAKAYKKVLSYANQGGMRAEAALQELMASPQIDAQTGEAGLSGGLQPDPGKVTATTSALSLEERVQAAARARLGRKLRANEVSKFVSLYQDMESSFNTTASSMQDSAAVSGEDASIEEIPGADVAADQFIDSDFAQEEAGQSAYGYLGALRNLLGG